MKKTFRFTEEDNAILGQLAQRYYGNNQTAALCAAIQSHARELDLADDGQGWIITGYVAEEVLADGAACHECGRRFTSGQVLYRPVFHRARGGEQQVFPLLPDEALWECPFCAAGEDNPDRQEEIEAYSERYEFPSE